MSSPFKKIIENPVVINESMKETSYAQKENSYFREFSHNEPDIKTASAKIEEHLKTRNPGSIVNRIDDGKFIMIHTGGDLVTNVNTYKGNHFVGTHYISPEPKDYALTKTEVKDSKVYEDIRNQVIVRGNMGSSVHFRQKPPEVIKNNLQRLQQDFFSGHRPKH